MRTRVYFFWPLILWWAIGVHDVYGLLLITHGNEIDDLAILGGLNVWIDAGASPSAVGIGVLICAQLATIGVIKERRLHRAPLTALLAPQYTLLVVAMVADVYLFAAGSYRGRSVSRVVLVAALWPLFMAQLLHTIAIWERLIYRWTPREEAAGTEGTRSWTRRPR